jgi:AbrB family looped-hinge helix DNA binding protein
VQLLLLRKKIMARSKKTAPRLSDRGFSEAPQEPFLTSGDGKPGFGITNRVRLTLGPGGRVVIPAALREAMEVQEGDTLLAWIEDGELHLLSPQTGARQAQAMLSGLIPKGVSLSDELVEDRRGEAKAEANG